MPTPLNHSVCLVTHLTRRWVKRRTRRSRRSLLDGVGDGILLTETIPLEFKKQSASEQQRCIDMLKVLAQMLDEECFLQPMRRPSLAAHLAVAQWVKRLRSIRAGAGTAKAGGHTGASAPLPFAPLSYPYRTEQSSTHAKLSRGSEDRRTKMVFINLNRPLMLRIILVIVGQFLAATGAGIIKWLYSEPG